MVGIFDFFTKREKTVKHKTIESEISNLCEKMMDGIIDLSETANKMKKLKEQLKEVPEDGGDDDKNSSTNPNQEDNTNSASPSAPPIAASPAPASSTTDNADKGFLANFNIFGNKPAESGAEPTAEPAAELQKPNPEPEPEPEKKQEAPIVSSESPLPRPDAVIPNKDFAVAVAAAPASGNTVGYTEYLANRTPNAEYQKNIRGGKDKKKHKKTKHAKRSSSGKRTKKLKHNIISKEAEAQAQAQAQAQTQAQTQAQAQAQEQAQT
jgi:hypothetical protein